MFSKKFKLIVLIFCMVLVMGYFTINTQAVSTVLLAVQGAIVDGNLVKFSGVNGIGVDTGISAASVVIGPGSSTDHAIVRWDSTTGTAILDSVVTISDAGAIAAVTSISMTGELDLTGANAVIDLNPAATGSQKVVNLTPSATLAATSTWDGFFIDATALDPLTGGTTFIHGFHADFSGVLSTDGDDAVCGGTYILLPTGDTAHSYAHTHVLNEMTVAGSQSGFGSLGGALTLSFTATYRGLWFDWDAITRDANAPVLEGMRIELPANYTNFGTSFGAYFSGGGETLTICDGTYSLNLGGNMLVTATGARGIDITGATTSAQLYIGGTNILANGEQAIFVNCPSEDGATNAIWITLGSTVVTGDLTGARIKTTSQAASGGDAASGVNVRGVYAQAIVAASKHAGLLQGGLFVADVSAGSVTAYNIHILCGHYSAGESTVIGGDLYVGLLRSQTREDNARTVAGYDALLALENEAIQGDGGTVDAAIRIFDTNIAGSVIAFTYGIDMNGAIITSDIRLSSAHTITDGATGIAISLLSPTTISGLGNVTSAAADYIMIWDATDSTLKKCDMGEVIGASIALDNLASVQINTTLLSDAADTDSLGTVDAEWLNLYIGDAGKIYCGLGQDTSIHRSAANTMTLTASAGVITSAGLTVGGNFDLNEFAIDFSDDLGVDEDYSGITDTANVGETVAIGDLLYYDWTDVEWKKAKADAAATMPALRIALAIATDGNPCLMLVMGYIRDDDAYEMTGSMIYVSDATAGAVQYAPPADAGDQVQRIGVGITADKMFFCPSIDVGEI